MCGHTFCQGCLSDWFTTTLMQYMTSHPEWTPDPPELAHARLMLRRILDAQSRAKIESHIQHMELHVAQPPYSCPSCRTAVKKRPIEAFALKAIVRTIAAAEDEQGPQEATIRGATRENPWEGFFPAFSSQS